MGTKINRGRGKLYRDNSQQFVADIKYQVSEDLDVEPVRWGGEFSLTEYIKVGDDDRYIIELEDGRKGKCFVKKRVNRAVSGVPPRYIYHFKGLDSLEQGRSPS